MDGFAESLLKCIRETDTITWIATFTAIMYVVLALRENIWCWSFGIVSSALFVSINFNQELWYESILNIFYVVLGVYGWISWSKEKPGEKDSSSKPELVISKIPPGELLIAVGVAVTSGIILGIVSSSVMKGSFAYMDALVATFSVVVTWMTARKYIENWLFWIAINASTAGLFIMKGPSMYLVAVLYIFYTFMAVGGYFAWKKSLKG